METESKNQYKNQIENQYKNQRKNQYKNQRKKQYKNPRKINIKFKESNITIKDSVVKARELQCNTCLTCLASLMYIGTRGAGCPKANKNNQMP